MISALIGKLTAGEAIDAAELEQAVHAIMAGSVDAPQIAGLLVGLACRPPDAKLLASAARALRSHRLAVYPRVRPLIDTCGTGGSGARTFNISTAAAMVVAAAGGAVAKHGNRGVSSPVGSADVLEAAGCALDIGPAQAVELLDAVGFVLMFAPAYHPAMAQVAPVRRSLGVRTIFNLLGPLANPALAERQLLGVAEEGLTRVMAEALAELGSRSALVVHCAGLDEIGLHAKTHGYRVDEGVVESFAIDPQELGFASAPLAALRGGDAATNAEILRSVLNGAPGPRTDVVALNAGAALMIGGIVGDVADGIALAQEQMASGKAHRVLERYAESSTRLAGTP